MSGRRNGFTVAGGGYVKKGEITKGQRPHLAKRGERNQDRGEGLISENWVKKQIKGRRIVHRPFSGRERKGSGTVDKEGKWSSVQPRGNTE